MNWRRPSGLAVRERDRPGVAEVTFDDGVTPGTSR